MGNLITLLNVTGFANSCRLVSMKRVFLTFITFATAVGLIAQTAPKAPAANGIQPYSADEKTEQIRSNKTTVVSTAHIYRDSKGRTRREVTYADPTGGNAKRTAITISDPVAGVLYELDPSTKTAYREALPSAGTGRSGGGGGGGERERREGGGIGEGGRGEGERVEGGGSGGAGERREGGGSGGEGERREGGGAQNQGARKHEDLGIQTLNGFSVHASRNTVTAANGATVDERWVSVDLGVDLKSAHSDTVSGQTIHTLTNIKRTAPAASLFQVPQGYTLKQRAQ